MLERAIRRTKAYYCLECGICTGSCPVSRYQPQYSPRLMVERALLAPDIGMLEDPDVWACLTCGTCSARCPSTVDYNEFTRAMREEARGIGSKGTDTHAGVLRAIMNLEAARTTDRDLGWIADDVRVAKTGKVLLFAGCLPYFGVVFEHLGTDTVAMANSTIRLMNACGVRPVVSDKERCCGHDLYWSGDVRRFRRLAHENLTMIKESGATAVVFVCPECSATVKDLYGREFGPAGIEALHISEFLEPYVESGKLGFTESETTVTYQDPCRLGRFQGIYDAPRGLLGAVSGLELVEMPRTCSEALCCGSSAWVGCTRTNKRIQLERMAEAAETGAKTLVTACPKCSIHLSCARADGDLESAIEIEFLTDLLAGSLEK